MGTCDGVHLIFYAKEQSCITEVGANSHSREMTLPEKAIKTNCEHVDWLRIVYAFNDRQKAYERVDRWVFDQLVAVIKRIETFLIRQVGLFMRIFFTQ